jgi:predicted Zn-dependent protease with MMP-like domain
MLEITDEQFESYIAQAMDEMPEEYIKRLNNVLITFEDEPSAEQRQKQKLRADQTLFGLYEGIPMNRRGAGYNLVLPDRITIFKGPMARSAPSLEALKAQVKHTLWHEIAHFYGLDHDRIHEIERHWH